MQSEVTKKTALYGATAVLSALLLGVAVYNLAVVNVQPPTEQTYLPRFSSYPDLVRFLEAGLKTQPRSPYFNSPWRVAWSEALTANVIKMPSYAVTDASEYSQTNIQVAGVDEADIVKTDGTYIYVVSNNTLFILKAYPPEEAKILSKIGFNGTLREIFVDGDKVAILGSSASYPYETYRQFTIIDDKTHVEVYDIFDRSNPVLVRNFSISGNYFNSRMTNGYVYLVVSQPAYLLYDTLVLPKIYDGDRMTEINASQIYYANISDYSYAFTTVAAINLQNDTQEPTHETYLLGSTSNMYVSQNNIYITFWTQNGGTLIYRIRIENEVIKGEAKGEVPGTVLNQFSMDEYNGYFRIATTTWTSENNIYVLDMNLTRVGKLENIAPGERIYSVRFMGKRGYVVTFRQVDPFFALDLQNPFSPKVLGVLKIPRYSSYLHPYDEDHIIGIGKDPVNVKISLFDVSNVTDPKEIDSYQVSASWSDSLILSDHKALLFNSAKSLLVMPVETYDYNGSFWQGAFIFNITIENGIVLKGRIAHAEISIDYYYTNVYAYSVYFVKRSLFIDNVLYTISDKKVMMHNLETLAEINKIELI